MTTRKQKAEDEKRRDEALKRALSMPPKPRKAQTKKGGSPEATALKNSRK